MKLSVRTTVLALALSATTVAHAQQASWFDPNLGRLSPQVDYDFMHTSEQDVGGPADDLTLDRHDLRVAIPVRSSDTQEFSVHVAAGVWDIDTDARLRIPNSDLPEHLWDLRLGGSWRRKLENDWIVGADVTIGSPSDKPFDTAEEVSVNVLGHVRVPAGERNAWLFFLQYANDRPFAQHVPLPGVAYQWVVSPRRFRAILGVPFSSIYAEPIDRLSLELRYILLRRIHAEVGYRVLDPVKVYLGFDWDNDRFFRAGRRDDDDRLFYYEKRVATGVRWKVVEGLTVDVGGGYAFDRFFFEGEDYDDRGDSRVEISDGFFAGVKASYRF